MPDAMPVAKSSRSADASRIAAGDAASPRVAGAQAMSATWALGAAADRVQAALSIDATRVVAVDVGATHTRVAMTGPRGFELLIVKRTADLPSLDGQGVIPGLLATIQETIEAAGLGAPAAIGVAIAAYVDPSGVILQQRPFGIPSGSGVRDRLADRFGVPVIVDNDANFAAVAEVTAGAGRGLQNVAVITLGTNIGLGIVAGGRIIRGAHGAAGEAGTFLVPARRGRGGRSDFARAGRLGEGRTVSPAGYAILEELVGGGALFEFAKSHGSGAPSVTPGATPLRDGIFPRAAAGDRRAQLAVRHGIEGWAMLIANLVALLDPEAFVLSGGLVEEAPAFIEPLRRRAADLCPLPPDIRIGDLGAQSGLAGAVVAARSVLRTPNAVKATLNGSDSSIQGRASGHLFREVER
jgi:glucokinase